MPSGLRTGEARGFESQDSAHLAETDGRHQAVAILPPFHRGATLAQLLIQALHLTPIPAALDRPLGEGLRAFGTFTMGGSLSWRRLAPVDIRRTLERLGTNGGGQRRPPGRRVRPWPEAGAGGR
jgi:hypothetical protein